MSREKGFSLLEVLVAFGILAISLGILLKIFSSGVNTAIIAEEYTIASQIAESLMAKNGIEEPLAVGKISGTEVDKYHWRVTVENVPNPVDETNEQLVAVKVEVQWGNDESSQRKVELNTLKVGLQQ
ncbi:MAG: type II secretion system protein [Methylococcales bacterium]|nr:type II secretion system protein [Methylococcales bacterium]